MKATSTIQLINLFQQPPSKENAEKIVQIPSEDTDQVDDLKKSFLTKDDMIVILNKIENKGNWVVGVVAAMLSIAIALFKIL